MYLEVRHGRVNAMSDSLLQLTPPQIPDPIREIVALGNIPEQTVTPDAPVLVVAPTKTQNMLLAFFQFLTLLLLYLIMLSTGLKLKLFFEPSHMGHFMAFSATAQLKLSLAKEQ